MKILIIEDQPLQVEAIVKIVVSCGGKYNCIDVCRSELSAIAYILRTKKEKNCLNIIISDMSMPIVGIDEKLPVIGDTQASVEYIEKLWAVECGRRYKTLKNIDMFSTTLNSNSHGTAGIRIAAITLEVFHKNPPIFIIYSAMDAYYSLGSYGVERLFEDEKKIPIKSKENSFSGVYSAQKIIDDNALTEFIKKLISKK